MLSVSWSEPWQAKISEAWQSIKAGQHRRCAAPQLLSVILPQAMGPCAQVAFLCAEQPKNSKLKLSELGLEGFSLVLAKLGMTDRETAVALFKLFDKDNSGAVDFDEWVIALNVMSSKDSAVKMRALFEFCDLNGDGKVTRKELGDSLSSLFHVVSKLTNGRFLRGETLQRMAITESEVASAVVEHALIDIFQASAPAISPACRRAAPRVLDQPPFTPIC